MSCERASVDLAGLEGHFREPNTRSGTSLDIAYTNDTGLGGTKVFTGSSDFQGKEIEVFEITEYPALPNKSHWREREKSLDKICSAVERAGQQSRFGEEGGCNDNRNGQHRPRDIAPEIDCSRGDMHLSGLVLGRTPDSPGAKR
jgi:hypothetical protein